MTTMSPPLTWIVVLARCPDCNKPGPTVEKQPGTTVRVTFTCYGDKCGKRPKRNTV